MGTFQLQKKRKKERKKVQWTCIKKNENENESLVDPKKRQMGPNVDKLHLTRDLSGKMTGRYKKIPREHLTVRLKTDRSVLKK